MALKGQEVMVALMVVMVAVWSGAQAQSSTCTSSLMALAPCLNFVTGNTTIPTSSCCSQLASVVQSQPRCLCSMLNGNMPNIGITINQTLAVTLPGACKVQTPPMSICNGANGPTSGPASGPSSAAIPPTGSQTDPSKESPVAEAPTTPSTPSVPSGSGTGSGSGSKATPSTNNNSSDGSKFGASSFIVLFVLFFGMKL